MSNHRCPLKHRKKANSKPIVTPAKAGVQALNKLLNKGYNLDPGLRRDDGCF